MANGDKVKRGEELFLYDSIDYRQRLLDLLFEQTKLMQNNKASTINLRKIQAQLKASQEHLTLSKGIIDKIKTLEKKKLIAKRQLAMTNRGFLTRIAG